ncbi:MAG: hypothetical protein Q9163_005062 [Psora crenata]
MAASRAPLYKDVLTPALHRRFTSSALLALFLCYLEAILIAEKTSWARTTPSQFTTFKQQAIRLSTVQTIAWYLFSAWWFSEVYIWSAPQKADLNWLAQGR